MPLMIETEGQKRRMKQLENELSEKMSAVEIFDRPQVLIFDE